MAPQPQLNIDQQRALAKARARAKARGGSTSFAGTVLKPGSAAPVDDAAPELLRRPADPAFYDRAAAAREAENITPDKVMSDIGRSAPLKRVERGIVGAAEGTANLPRDLSETFAVPFAMGSDPETVATMESAQYGGDAAYNLPEKFAKRYQQGGFGEMQQRMSATPRIDFSAAKIPLAPEEETSVSGGIMEGLVQFLAARGAIGKVARGGGIGAQIGKSAAAVGTGFAGDQGRVADLIDPAVIPEGPLRSAAEFLRTQPDDSPLVGRFKNMLEDAVFNVGAEGVIRGAGAGVNTLRRGVSGPTAPAPSAPVTAVPPTARPAQPGPAGAGQQPGVINAVPAAAPSGANPIAVAKHDARNIYRMMKAAGVPANDIKPLLADLLQGYQGLNDSRMRLALFAREYLPQRLPKPVADAVSAQFDAFGFQQLTGSGPGAGVMRSSIDDLRQSQKGYLEGEFDAAFGKQDLVTTKGKIRKLKSDNAETIYRTQIDRQQRNLMAGKATPEQKAAADGLLQTMARDDFFKKLPPELDFAAKNEGFGGLWEYVHAKPLESAHWLQSKLGFMERGGGDNAGLYKQMRRMVLNDLEEAVPGYRGARMQHGDAIGQELAVNLGRELRAAAGDRIKVADIAERVSELPKSQQKVGALSVKEMLKNEFRKTKGASRVDPATGQPIDEQQAIITQLQKEGMLDALETVFPGSTKGPRATAAIRKVMRENEGLPSYRSDTGHNIKKQEGAVEAIRSPFNKAMRGVREKTGYSFTIPADLIAMGTGVSPVPFPFTASKVAGDIASWASKPDPRKSASTAALLYGTPPPGVNALTMASPPRAPRTPTPRGARPALPPPTQESLDDLLRQYDAIDPGANPQEAERLRRQIQSTQKALAKLPAPRPPERQGISPSGPIASQIIPPAAAATVASFGPEDESFEDKLPRMLAAAGLASGVRNLNLLRSVARGADQAGIGGSGKGPPRPPSGRQTTPAEDLARATKFRLRPGSEKQDAWDWNNILKDETDPNVIMDALGINLNPQILKVPRGRAMIERTHQAVRTEIQKALSGNDNRPPLPPVSREDIISTLRQAEATDTDQAVRASAKRAADELEFGKPQLRSVEPTPSQSSGGKNAERLQRAREQGFDVDTPLYHGTTKSFDEFDKAGSSAHASHADHTGVFLDPDAGVAAEYAGTNRFGDKVPDGSKIFAVYAKKGKWVTLKQLNDRAKQIAQERGVKWEDNIVSLRAEAIKRFDSEGVIGRWDGHPRDERHVFDPKNLRSQFDNFDAPSPRQSSTQGGSAPPPSPPGSGKVGEAARLQRAKEQGFDVDTPLYHGTTKDFTAFRTGSPKEGMGEGVYLTTRPSTANLAATGHPGEMKFANPPEYPEGANVMPVYARLRNPYTVSVRAYGYSLESWAQRHGFKGDDIWSQKAAEGFAKELKRRGHDGIKLLDGAGGQEVLIFDPKNIRGQFDSFDPANTQSTRLVNLPSPGSGRTPPAGTNALSLGSAKPKQGKNGLSPIVQETLRDVDREAIARLIEKKKNAPAANIPEIDAQIAAIYKRNQKPQKPPPPVLSKEVQDLDAKIKEAEGRFTVSRRKFGRFPDQRDAIYQAHIDEIADLKRQRAEALARDNMGKGLKKFARQAYNAGPKIAAIGGLGLAGGVIAGSGVAAYEALKASAKKDHERNSRVAPPEDTRPRDNPARNSRNRELVQQVQTQLNALGWRLKTDGVMLGSDALHGAQTETQKAVRRFQYEQGLPVTGLLDAATLDAIDAAYRDQLNKRASAARPTEAYQEAR